MTASPLTSSSLQTASMPSSLPEPASSPEAQVEWFGESRRLVGGKPDARYGWLETPDGPCIVKAIDPGLTAYASTLLQQERRMLPRLAELGAPAPLLVDLGRDDWLVTRFAGLSLQFLQTADACVARTQGTAADGTRFPFTEQVAACIHLLRRLQPMASSGVLAIDLYAGNIVCPLTDLVQGQLRLHEVCVIDHGHTLEAGMATRRPVWLKHSMAHIAPELRAAIHSDQQALMVAFEAAGADLPGYSQIPAERDENNRRAWACYDAPQQLQMLLDSGALDAGRAMQFAVGTLIAEMLGRHPSESTPGLRRVVERMTASVPATRFALLSDAADALAEEAGTLPLVSRYRWEPVGARDLAGAWKVPMAAAPPAAEGWTAMGQPLGAPSCAARADASAWSAAIEPRAPGIDAGAIPQGGPDLAPAAGWRSLLPSARWFYAGIALGAAAAASGVWPL